MLFISPEKLFSFRRYLSFCFDFFGLVEKRFDKNDFFGLVGKWLDKKTKVNFKIYDVTNYWEINNCNTHIAQYLKK